MLKYIIYSFLLATLTDSSCLLPGNCRFEVSDKSGKSFENARKDCTRQKMKLLEIKDAFTQSEVERFMATNPDLKGFYLWLNIQVVNGSLYWEPMEPVGFTKWPSGEPQPINFKAVLISCTTAVVEAAVGAVLHTTECFWMVQYSLEENHPYLCYEDLTAVSPDMFNNIDGKNFNPFNNLNINKNNQVISTDKSIIMKNKIDVTRTENNINIENTNYQLPLPANPGSSFSPSNIGFAVGVSLSLAFLVIVISVAVVVFYRRKRRKNLQNNTTPRQLPPPPQQQQQEYDNGYARVVQLGSNNTTISNNNNNVNLNYVDLSYANNNNDNDKQQHLYNNNSGYDELNSIRLNNDTNNTDNGYDFLNNSQDYSNNTNNHTNATAYYNINNK
ncbi:hypothetical protein HELRODRAFT_182566 [Helobdella robusta]|uniref:C-type lectin domain-containing protein n=1 Tax=Helobdella robusta TaxID=6412 RepID=T1FID0_HELRO|nr:hypothetical protein HELRODRAFT_182566 [Helobdella robusta]ESN90858.1 hypothetical protein HELRODRAFT_182566 [Helobdella robusta]